MMVNLAKLEVRQAKVTRVKLEVRQIKVAQEKPVERQVKVIRIMTYLKSSVTCSDTISNNTSLPPLMDGSFLSSVSLERRKLLD